jgi:hypothetical protein
MKNTKKKIISLFALFFLLFVPIVSYTMNSAFAADTLWDAQVGIEDIGQKAYGETGAPQDIRVTIMEIINVVLQLLAVIFVALIIMSGYQWMTAGGSEEKVGKAKKNLSNAVIGLVIILASWSISYFILKSLVAVSENDPNYLHIYN